MKKIKFAMRPDEEYIALIQLLKATSLVDSGATAQAVVTEGLVTRNGEVELRKRAKCVPGDVIGFHGTLIEVS